MQNLKVGCIPVRQTVNVDNKFLKIKKIIKEKKIGIIIGGISLALVSTYAVLIIKFINLIKIMY